MCRSRWIEHIAGYERSRIGGNRAHTSNTRDRADVDDCPAAWGEPPGLSASAGRAGFLLLDFSSSAAFAFQIAKKTSHEIGFDSGRTCFFAICCAATYGAKVSMRQKPKILQIADTSQVLHFVNPRHVIDITALPDQGGCRIILTSGLKIDAVDDIISVGDALCECLP